MKAALPLSDAVYEGLKADLARSAYRAGTVLSEETLARRFRVSRTPVRKALARLEQQGLVRILPKRGIVIPEVSPGELRELFDVREALEGIAARRAAGNVDPRALRAVEAPLRRLAARRSRVSVEAARAAGAAVHRLALATAGNALLARMLEQVNGRLVLAQLISYYEPARVRDSIREHLAIVEALRRGDPDRAEARAREHVARFRRHIFGLLAGR
ncbi:MAG: GntR family transcriptional regulator [Candidatus Rokubacteria bacterium]|nr:GntR family transcriptional regulator [Candidatus Rokubacteria bacterium]MBI4254953.1 GntR family transcriptional regulator [Candidatus Rokubacteria bacterium]